MVGHAVGAADQGGQLTICYEEQLPFCSEWSSEGALLAKSGFTTSAADSAVAVTRATTLASLNGTTPVSTYVWLQLDSLSASTAPMLHPRPPTFARPCR